MTKQLLSFLLCLVMAVSLFSGIALADEPPENGWYIDPYSRQYNTGDGNWYPCAYYYENGEKVSGWQFIDGNWYCFSSMDAQYAPDQGVLLRFQSEGEYFVDENGMMVTNYWHEIKELIFHADTVTHTVESYDPPRWEYYGEDGKRVYGWEYIDGYWYYFDDTGLMQTGWLKMNGTWYYLNSWGGMRSGWLSDEGVWYYVKSNGAMARDEWERINGKWYLFDSTGAMLTGWQNVDGEDYYLTSSGAMETGWLWDEDAWYYLKSWGGMAADEWEKVNGKWYLFDEEGKMLTGWQGQYYLTSSGAMETGWGYIDGNWYYFGSDGAMKTGWQKVSGKWYYMDPATGVMQTGWLVDSDGKRYYLSDSGAMLTGTQTIDGVEYIFNRSGALTGA